MNLKMSKNLVDFREIIVYNNSVAGVSHIGKIKTPEHAVVLQFQLWEEGKKDV